MVTYALCLHSDLFHLPRMSRWRQGRRSAKIWVWSCMECNRSWLGTRWCWSVTMTTTHSWTNSGRGRSSSWVKSVASTRTPSWPSTRRRRKVRLVLHSFAQDRNYTQAQKLSNLLHQCKDAQALVNYVHKTSAGVRLISHVYLRSTCSQCHTSSTPCRFCLCAQCV